MTPIPSGPDRPERTTTVHVQQSTDNLHPAHERTRRGAAYWGYLTAAGVFAALVPTFAALGASLEGANPLGRIAVAIGVAACAGIALRAAATAAATRRA